MHGQDKVQSGAITAAITGISLQKRRLKLRMNKHSVKLDNQDIENVVSFTYLESVISCSWKNRTRCVGEDLQSDNSISSAQTCVEI